MSQQPTASRIRSSPARAGKKCVSRSPVVLYPNPFGDTAALDAVLRPGEAVRVDAFDLLGRHAATLFDGVATGDETLRLDTRPLARGAYTLRIVTPRGTLARLGVRR